MWEAVISVEVIRDGREIPGWIYAKSETAAAVRALVPNTGEGSDDDLEAVYRAGGIFEKVRK